MPTPIEDADVLKAVEALNGDGSRQLRMVRVEGQLYMDDRDVHWMLETMRQRLSAWIIADFWAQVAIVGLLYTMGPSEYARLFFAGNGCE